MSRTTIDYSRRDFITLFGSVGFGLAANPNFALESGEAVFTPPGLERDLPSSVLDAPRAVFKQRGAFDLNDPAQLGRAQLKSIFSLDGSKSYVLRVSRTLICPPNRPARTLLHELQFWYSLVEQDGPLDGKGEPTSVTTHSTFTRVAVDPVTMKPKREIRIAEVDRVIHVPDTLFAASVKRNLRTGAERRIEKNDAATSVEAGTTSPYMLLGPDLVFLAKGGHNDDGEHQPQVDMSSWASPMSEIMDESRGSATARYSFSGISRARIFSWADQYEGPQGTQALNHKVGVKSPTFEGLPDTIKAIMVEHYPDRI